MAREVTFVSVGGSRAPYDTAPASRAHPVSALCGRESGIVRGSKLILLDLALYEPLRCLTQLEVPPSIHLPVDVLTALAPGHAVPKPVGSLDLLAEEPTHLGLDFLVIDDRHHAVAALDGDLDLIAAGVLDDSSHSGRSYCQPVLRPSGVWPRDRVKPMHLVTEVSDGER